MLPTRRKELCDYLNRTFINYITDKKRLQEFSNELKTRYGLETYHSDQILSMSTSIDLESDEVLYCILSVVNEKYITTYFTDNEIKKYSNVNFEKKIDRNLQFKCIQIENDQWIGRIEVSKILEMADNNMLHYEMETQRVMQLKRAGGTSYYAVTVNEKAVKKIMESMRNRLFIPNTITLNIPIDKAIPYYDEETFTLHITDIDYLDIIDGYHRYVAMNRLVKEGFQFTTPMEVRITNFSVDKAKLFIFQEDQKTQMTKVDSNSFNVASIENKVVDLLRKDNGIFSGVFEKTSIIDPGYLSQFIKPCFANIKKEDQLKVIVQSKKKIIDKLTELISIKPDILDKKWETDKILTFAYIAMRDLDVEEIDNIYEIVTNLDHRGKFYTNTILKIDSVLHEGK